ncbi:peptide ABC transporter permease [Sulfurovum lithotrophicum]|uniref:Peptide ABC transporter permease n=1 Tax=Sulfurovum lithotrophicum TaxID=206403 RepID=A0A7U4M2L6_9BACT|nr:ABC transporter permease [Sulfurovum lithotrophicum]AKF25692.1 peptide ABC transporter permease [Sulfurovum lithotrophicum]
MNLTLLWTDIMVWILIFALMGWGWVVSRSPQVKKQWRTIFRSRIAMASAIVLLFYLSFALLDSVHMRHTVQDKSGQGASAEVHYKGEMVSLLDLLFAHTIEHTERTYSAPFATHEYAKSIVVDEKDNVTRQAYLPLKYVNIPAGESETEDIVRRSLGAFGLGLFASLILVFLHLLLKGKERFSEKVRHVWRGETELPWRTAYLTFLLLTVTFVWLYILSYHYHVLGTDKVGGDVFYQSLKSIRTGVLIGILTTLVMLPVSIVLGISAGFFGGWIDDVIQYIYTTLNSIPGVLLIAAAVLVMQVMMDNHPQWFETTLERSDLRLLFLIMILGVTSWTGLCRLLRAETLKISQVEFVTAAKAFGVSKWKIIFRHIMPNLMHIILISVVLDFSGLVLAEAVLSYVGVGVDPTMYSWGNMINQARLEMAREPMVWWLLFSAFIFMFILVLAANLLSDRVQTVLDPRNKS